MRNRALNLTVVERSLDAITGAVQILVGFAAFQEHMALRLDSGVGTLTVMALSYQLLDIDVPSIPTEFVGSDD